MTPAAAVTAAVAATTATAAGRTATVAAGTGVAAGLATGAEVAQLAGELCVERIVERHDVTDRSRRGSARGRIARRGAVR